MKLFIFSLLSIFLLTLPHIAYAEIIEGNAESDTSVTTNIQGSGQVHTHIESTVNGQTKTLDSNQPGSYTLHNSSSETTITPTISPTTTATPTAEITQAQKWETHKTVDAIAQNIQLFIHKAIQKLLSLFHL